MGGHLLSLAHQHGYTELTEAVATLVSGSGPSPDAPTHPPLYGGVLRWTVSTIADVVVDKMGRQVRGDKTFQLTIRTESGDDLGVDELPQPESTIMKAVVDVLAGDTTQARNDLDLVVFAMNWTSQMEALVEAVLWLDRLLDAPGSTPADTLPW